MEPMVAYEEGRIALRYKEMLEEYSHSLNLMLIIGGIAVAFVVVMSYFLTRGITKPLEAALKDRPKLWARVAGYIVQGDAKPQVGEAGDTKKTPYVRVREEDFPVLEDEVDPFS